jgi:molybdate transport system substrate-binding protein
MGKGNTGTPALNRLRTLGSVGKPRRRPESEQFFRLAKTAKQAMLALSSMQPDAARRKKSRSKPDRVFRQSLACGLLTILCVMGCSKKSETELVLLCGTSFVPPTQELCERFTAETGIEIVTTSAGSEDFLPLVKAGQKGDILVTHDPFLDYVRDANALFDSAHVGFVAPVLVVQKGSTLGVSSLTDLTKPDLRVALTDPQYSTCGEMIFSLLEKKGIKEAVMTNVGNRLTKGHGNIGTLLQTQAIDAAVMWNGVANTFADSLDVVPTPYEYDTEIRVHVIGLKYSQRTEALGKFLAFIKEHGTEAFTKHGYVK